VRTTALLLTLANLVTLTACKRADDRPATPDIPTKPAVAPRPTKDQPRDVTPIKRDDRMYTTYFYTAAEAVVHGYEEGTKVRIVALADAKQGRKAGTIWEGTVGVGETKLVPTGPGVFGFLSDKKAAILAGTPSSCAVVGYFLKDQDGKYRSKRFFTQLPSSAYSGDERLIVWAYEPAEVTVRMPKTQKVLATKKLAAGERLVLDHPLIAPLGNQVLEIASTTSTVGVQVYYDQGFIVPSSAGRGAGTEFYTFVGKLTAGSNDLDLIALAHPAKVTVTDLETGKRLFDGTLEPRTTQTLALQDRYVRVRSDREIQVVVAAFENLASGYAEHHFATGLEGGGIDNDFAVTTSGGLWLFSYFADNEVTVTDAKGTSIFTGKLGAGTGHELMPGAGLYRVKASKGLSAMGGASSCGADYSPAAGMFAVDDAMLRVIQQVTEARIEEAKARGVTLTPSAAAAAPISAAEWDRYGAPAKATYKRMSVDEANQRAAELTK